VTVSVNTACPVVAMRPVCTAVTVARKEYSPVVATSGAVRLDWAGASAVGVGTALSYDPLVCREINRTLRAYLARQGMSRISELIGALRDAEGVAADG